MTAVLVGALVAAAVAVPAVTRAGRDRLVVRRLGPPPDARAARPTSGAGAEPLVLGALRRTGAWTRGVLRRPADPGADLVAGVAAVLGLLGAVVLSLPVGMGLAAVAIAVPAGRRRAERRRQEGAVRTGLPDVVDLFRLAVGAGLSVHQSIDVVAPEAPDPIGAALTEVLRRRALGVRLGDALEALDVLGEPARPLASALTGAARYGTPLGSTLERVVADARVLRRRRAEEHARKLPVKLLFPLVMCVLPAFGLLAVVPLLAGSLPSLSP